MIENVKKAFQSLQLHFTVTQKVKTVQTSINSRGKKTYTYLINLFHCWIKINTSYLNCPMMKFLGIH